MAITVAGISQIPIPKFGVGGGINVGASFSTSLSFPPSNIWGYPSLQVSSINDDDGSVSVFVSQFIDSKGTHNVDFIGVFASQCTGITYGISMFDCLALGHCITEFFA